jgi:hypothetical protein
MKLKVESFNIGSDGSQISPDCKIEFAKDILVTLNFSSNPSDMIGEVKNVYKNPDGIYADIHLFPPNNYNYYTDLLDEDGLLIPKEEDVINKELESLYLGSYPAIGGRVTKWSKRDVNKTIDRFELNRVSFCSSRNSDHSIQSIGEQLKDNHNQ